MADEKTEQKPQETPPEKPAGADKPADTPAAAKAKAEKGKSNALLPWIIVATVVVVCAGAGIGLGLLFAGHGKTENPVASNQFVAQQPTVENAPASQKTAAQTSKGGDMWYFDLDPVVANLNEPGATRYVRAVITLEVSPELSSDKGTPLLTQKKPLLINLLTIYLAGLNVDSTRGDKNLKKIQSEICDTFNEKLFPDSAPLIKGILIKEFAVQ
jgi:flagellar basal body-associated protein FliL